jgi:hypothetical protein
LAGRLGWQTWPVRLVKIKDGLKIENQHCIVSFQKQIKNQSSALLELLDLSYIAVGNARLVWP